MVYMVYMVYYIIIRDMVLFYIIIICLLHITCYILRCFSCRVLVFVLFESLRNIDIGDINESWSAGHFVDKTVKQFFPPNLTSGARRRLKYNVQLD